MNALYDVPRQFIMDLANGGAIHYTFSYAFVVNGFLCALVIGPLLGGIGTMVVAKRMAFFSQAVGNAALTGVAIGVIIGESYTAPYVSMFSFCLLFGLLLNFARNRTKMSADTLIGVFLSISLAIGATALLWVSAKVNTHILDTVMFGSILTVDDTVMGVLLVTALPAARRLDLWLGDVLARVAARDVDTSHALVVAIDAEALAEVQSLTGVWPVGRDVWAHVHD